MLLSQSLKIIMLTRLGNQIRNILPGNSYRKIPTEDEQTSVGATKRQQATLRATTHNSTYDSALAKFSKQIYLCEETAQAITLMASQCLQCRDSLRKQIDNLIDSLCSNRSEVDRRLQTTGLTASHIQTQLAATKVSLEKLVPEKLIDEVAQLRFKHQLLHELNALFLKRQKSSNLIQEVAFAIEAELKLRTAFSMFEMVHNGKDITNSDPELYAKVYRNISVITPPNPSQIDYNYKAMTKLFHILGGAMVRTLPYQSKICKKIILGWNLVLNAIRYERSLLHSLKFYSYPALVSVAQFYNLFEDGFLGLISGLGFQKIRTNCSIYVPRQQHDKQHLDIFKENSRSIPVRVLYNKQLSELRRQKKSGSKETAIESIIIHIHGGGYAVHSSRSSQGFTRKWANQLALPIFSIDYRKAPEVIHPEAALDCLQVYKFIVDHLQNYMRINPKNIYLAGDASGGSLACSLMGLILKQGLPVPKGLFLAYPGLDYRSIYYPSRRLIFNDPMIWPTVAEVFVQAYFPSAKEKNDPLASPILLTEQFVGGKQGDTRLPVRWPRTFIMLGDKDLVRDECLLFMQRMQESGIPFKCLLYENLGHGFLVTEGLIKYSTITVEHSIDLFRELIACNGQQKPLQ